ncbi:zinc finger protein 678-like isoform X2 [Aricia agestis]|uniref:zinc finger protein 678-like isoform X2 n=1 Tax=Aricia agestis TaxID=91739 RepID=UPI001C2040C1|nr:zinc finger protein 678-like isoform X2 [Aricia agestis]
MSCCILTCVNSEASSAPYEDVTFYKIPTEYHLKQLWTEAIGIPEWQLRPNSEVCSAHFGELDFTISETGEKIILEGAVPSLCLNTPEDLQSIADFRTCRVCLGMDRRMYHIRDYNLHHAYEMLLGIMVETVDRLPKMLCWECTSKLNSIKTFKEKALRTHLLLSERLAISNILTVSDIKSINRINFNLNSHLTLKYNEPDSYDVHIDHDQLDILQEIKIECSKLTEEPKHEVEDVDFKLEDGVKDEVNHSFSDSDDIELSELRTKKVRKRKGKVKKEGTEAKRKKRVKKEEVKEKVEDEDELEKFQRGPVKRRVRSYDISDSHFDTRPLTLEEQLAELQARAHSASYLAAPYKCDVCYKGFKSADTHGLHVVRHSEKYGEFECFICKRRFKNARHLRLHVTSLHTEQFSCKACDFVTRCRGIAIDHQKWHSGNTYECPHCPSKFGKFTSYMSHLRIKHSSRFACELCGYTFVSKRGVEMHKAKRHKLQDAQMKLDGPYCEECKLRFANDEAYLRHLTQSSVHSSDNDPNRIRNDWGCKEQLGVVRRTRKRRAPGVVTHWVENTDRPKQNIPCEQCGEQMDSYRSYAQHFRMAHPGLNRTKFSRVTGACMCEQCGKMFACKALLLDHMMSHSGEKRFKCETCDKAFTNKNNLAVHQRVHGAQVPTYRCPFCERQFHFYQNCNRHVKTVHKGVKQFQCEICGKEFTSAAGQRAHVDHVHHKKPRPKRVRARAPPAPPTAYRD